MPDVPRFFCPQIAQGRVALSPEESHHARSALRLQPGAEVILFDGAGTEGRGRLAGISKRAAIVEVERVDSLGFDHSVRLTVAVAMPRTHRQHFLIEKCTELGVYAIQPVICQRSVVRPRADSLGKWTRIAVEAAKQSRRAWVPRITDPAPFAEALADAPPLDLELILAPEAQQRTLRAVLTDHPGRATMRIWIGPEGGFTDEEVATVQKHGGLPASLGPSILRVETAAILTAGLITVLTDSRD